ncbi:MAG: hypothetical protein ACR2O6_03685 [Ilumatobacteraceae bacterium]
MSAFHRRYGPAPTIAPAASRAEASSRRVAMAVYTTIGAKAAVNIGWSQKPQPASTPTTRIRRRSSSGASIALAATIIANTVTTAPDA